MSPHSDPSDSIRRILTRAVLLVLPLVAVGVGAPRLIRMLRPGATPQAQVLAGLQQGGAGTPVAVEEKPRPPESPTPEQIEKARETQVALGKAQKGWESVTLISPRLGKRGEDGLEILPFQGFGLSVDSTPEGATVSANGEPLGEAPLLATVPCKPGEDVKVRVEKPPLPPFERTLRCRADTLVKLPVKLGK